MSTVYNVRILYILVIIMDIITYSIGIIYTYRNVLPLINEKENNNKSKDDTTRYNVYLSIRFRLVISF